MSWCFIPALSDGLRARAFVAFWHGWCVCAFSLVGEESATTTVTVHSVYCLCMTLAMFYLKLRSNLGLNDIHLFISLSITLYCSKQQQ